MFVVRATIYLYDAFMQEKVYADVAANLDQGHVAAWRAGVTANALVLEEIGRAPVGARQPAPRRGLWFWRRRGAGGPGPACHRSAGTTCCWSYLGHRMGGCACTSSPARWF